MITENALKYYFLTYDKMQKKITKNLQCSLLCLMVYKKVKHFNWQFFGKK